MMKNTTELLSVIVKAMSEEGIELTNVKIYEEAVELNEEVKVCIGSTGKGNDVWFLVRKVDTKDYNRFQLYSTDSMLDKILELFKESEWLPGDDIEAYGEWFTLVVEESSYSTEKNQYKVYRLLDENYSLSERMTIEDLKNNYTNASLEQGRFKYKFYWKGNYDE